MVPVVLELS